MSVYWLLVWGGVWYLRKAVENGKKLEIAIVLGVDLLIIMVVVILIEWLFVGFYGGLGVKLNKCKILDLELLVDLEFVLEVIIIFGEVLLDGFFGDYMGYYGGVEGFLMIRFYWMIYWKELIYLIIFSGRFFEEEVMVAIDFNWIYIFIFR